MVSREKRAPQKPKRSSQNGAIGDGQSPLNISYLFFTMVKKPFAILAFIRKRIECSYWDAIVQLYKMLVRLLLE